MYWAWKNVDSSYYGLFHYRRILDLSEQAQQIRTDYPIIVSNFCELTAMYWAWKNVDSSYYGLFHYRRILDLSEQAQQIRTDYPIIVSPFCELTAMYWAWKNVDSSYYGLFHYRRILDLSEQAQQIRTDYPIIVSPRSYNPKRQGLTTENITKLLQEYDIILPQGYKNHYNLPCDEGLDNYGIYAHYHYAKGLTTENITKLLQEYDIILPQGYKNHYNLPCDEGLDNYGIYAHYHYAKDLDKIIELIKSRHPEMQAALESTLFTYPPRWHIANIFIMRKELYFAYCEWLFSLLFDLSKETDLSDYTPYQARIYGFLSERMFNIWLAYQRHTQTLKILEAPMLLLTKHTKPLIGWDINEKHKRFYLFGVRVYKKSVNPKS